MAKQDTMTINFAGFIKDVEKAKGDINKKLAEAIKALAISALGAIIQNTPVDTGVLKSSWGLAVDNPNPAFKPTVNNPNNEAQQILSVAWVNYIPNRYVVYNNQDYAEVIEEGNWSKNAPAGMMLIGLQQAVAKFRQEYK